ncbi:MAG TPA: FtsX-like permease family protein [Candidatus Moranbacteria bacterium]|nr:FtsX-like permease family protein [Candidatus Moranbacteria bacterium]
MKIIDTIKISARSFRNNRLRTILTIMGIGVGIGSIFFLVSLGYGFQKVVLDRIATSDSLLSLDVFSGDANNGGVIAKSELSEIKSIKNITKVTPIIVQKTQIHSGDFTTDAKVNIVEPNFFRMEGINTERGELFGADSGNLIVVTTAVLNLLHIDENNFKNKKVEVNILVGDDNNTKKTVKRVYVISGVVKGKSKAVVYIPSKSVSDLAFNHYNRIKIRVSSEGQISPVRKKLMDKGYFVSSISDTVDQTRKIFRVIKIVLLSFGMLALIVSAIGMFNTMTISLLERTQEIAIMKSLGASAKDIWSMFLTESILIGFLGGALGIILGFAGTKFFNFILNLVATNFGGMKVQLFYIPFWFVVFIVVFSTLVGLITGFYPAKRAAALDTLEALRYK